ncbi:MAG: hypothetical protein AMXMBFR7_10100 [Planctomycetota bacterium]
MQLLFQHGEKIVTVVVLAIAGWIIAGSLEVEEPAALQDLGKDLAEIKGYLSKPPAEDFPWHPKNQVGYAERLKANFSRPEEGLAATPAYAYYPRPKRPYVDPKDKPQGADIQTPIVDDFAILKPPSEVAAEADHNGVYLTCRIPAAHLKYMIPVRVEIYRGATADKVEELAQTIDLNPEEDIPGLELIKPAKKEDPAKPKPEDAPKPEAGEPAGPSDQTSRSTKRAEDAPAAAEDAPVVDQTTLDPARFKDLLVTHDRKVAPKNEYFYKARLVARLVTTGANGLITLGDKRIRVKVAKDQEEVKPAKEGSAVKLYASSWTDALKVATPPSFKLRFAGMQGELPDMSLPPSRRGSPVYKGQFAMQVWVYPAEEWQEITVWTTYGEELKETLRYKDKTSGEQKLWEFKSGFKLAEIKAGEDREMKVVRVAVMEKKMGPDGQTEIEVPKLDALGRPIMEEKQVEQRKPTLIAVLEDIKSGAQEEHVRRGDFEKRKDAFIIMDRLLKEREEEERLRKQKVKEILEKKGQ